MNPLQFLIRKVSLRRGHGSAPSPYKLAKTFLELRVLAKNHLRNIFLNILGILSATFGLKGFLLTNEFIDGGATGISMLVAIVTDLPLFVLIPLINLPFLLLAYRTISPSFAFSALLSILGLSVSLAFIDVPDITKDPILVAVFGGLFLGGGIGLSIRGSSVLDGTEVLAIHLSRKLGTTIGDIIILINMIIFLTATYLLSIEIALYSMITYLSASKILDFVVEGIDEYVGVTIISSHHDEIQTMIIDKLGRGVTNYQGGTGYGRRGKMQRSQILYVVITRFEVNKLNTEIQIIDPNAFVVMTQVKDTRGGMIKKRAIPHN